MNDWQESNVLWHVLIVGVSTFIVYSYYMVKYLQCKISFRSIHLRTTNFLFVAMCFAIIPHNDGYATKYLFSWSSHLIFGWGSLLVLFIGCHITNFTVLDAICPIFKIEPDRIGY